MSASEKLKALEQARDASLDLVGEGDWTPQDSFLASLPLPQIVAVVEAAEQYAPQLKHHLAALDEALP